MSTVAELLPGDLVSNGGMSAVYITRTTHPIWPHLELVIWRMEDGSWSHDALLARQDVGAVTDATTPERRVRLHRALVGDPDEWQGGL